MNRARKNMGFSNVLLLFAMACSVSAMPISPSYANVSKTTLTNLPKFPVLLELSTRPWLYTLSQKYSRDITKLNDIPDEELKSIADAGVDVVWFMGLWQLGPKGLQHDLTDQGLLNSYKNVLPSFSTSDVIGSPYAITEYTVNSELGSDDDLANLRSRLRALGMGLCVDFVPNHSAIDAQTAIDHPDWYVRLPAGETFDGGKYISVNGVDLHFGSDIYSGSWTDVLQWNYWNEELREHMSDVLVRLAGMADMVRSDMSHIVLNEVFAKFWGSILTKNGFSPPKTEFWSVAISAAKSANPNFVFMAEAYVYGITSTPEDVLLQNLGFTFTYDKTLLDDMHNGQSIPSYVIAKGKSYLSKSANFLSNHDEPRAIPTIGGVPQSLAGAVIAYTLPGLRFFWWGQWEGFTAKLDVHLRRETEEPANEAVQDFYATLIPIIRHKVFQSDNWEFVNFDQSAIIGWKWTDTDGNKRLVAINYSPHDNQYGSAVLPECVGKSGDEISVTELLSGVVYQRSAQEIRTKGLGVLLAAWQSQIFDYSG